ncbi:MAG: nitrogenase component 1, partial [Clostridium sp.]
MELYKYFPVASDRMGIVWTLSTIEGACILEFGPAGTTHYAVESIGSLNGEDKARIYSTHMSESDLTFGNTERLKKSLLEIDVNIKPKYIFVMASSLSSIIGIDIQSVCIEIGEEINAKLIPIETSGLKFDYNKGVEEALYLLGKNIVQNTEDKNGKYNIIGVNIDSFNYESDGKEIQRTMKEIFNKELNTLFTANTSVEDIEKAALAELNIVIRRDGLKLAEYMKEKYNIPFVYKKPIGLAETIDFICEISILMNYKINKSNLDEEKKLIEKHLQGVRFKLRGFENKDVAIFGDEDTVISMKKFMKELNLNVHRGEVLYSTKLLVHDEEIIIRSSEYERETYLKEKELLMLIGDGISLNMKHRSYGAIQVSNPNLGKVNIYPYTPFVGFRGALYIL